MVHKLLCLYTNYNLHKHLQVGENLDEPGSIFVAGIAVHEADFKAVSLSPSFSPNNNLNLKSIKF
jgi:hypothetical protein